MALREQYYIICGWLRQLQAQEWIDAAVLAEEGALSTGRLLLEEAQGRQDDPRGSHETQSTRH